MKGRRASDPSDSAAARSRQRVGCRHGGDQRFAQQRQQCQRRIVHGRQQHAGVDAPLVQLAQLDVAGQLAQLESHAGMRAAIGAEQARQDAVVDGADEAERQSSGLARCRPLRHRRERSRPRRAAGALPRAARRRRRSARHGACCGGTAPCPSRARAAGSAATTAAATCAGAPRRARSAGFRRRRRNSAGGAARSSILIRY